MSVLPKLATSLGRNDEQPNIALAEDIAATQNTAAVRELAGLLNGRDKALKSDAIKTLYEVGARAPELIAPYIAQFKNLLASPDNRMVWGAMCAIDHIAGTKPEVVYALLPQITAAATNGSVITRDHAVKALAKLAAHERFRKSAWPLLLEQVRCSPMNQLPMYAEVAGAVATGKEADELRAVLGALLPSATAAAKKRRIEKVLRQLAQR